MAGFEAFDRYVAEHNIPEEEYPEALTRWLGEQMGGPPIRFEKVAPGQEQILEDGEQRDLDAVPSFLALRVDEHASGEPNVLAVSRRGRPAWARRRRSGA